MSSSGSDLLWKFWYPLVTRLTRNTSVTFLNYGFSAPDAPNPPPPLLPADEPDRACIALYHRVASQTDLRGRALLEVSCGHGGGASYVTRYLHPASCHALDRNPRAIALCQNRHRVPGLTFSRGNALALPFPDNSFDAVLNVEASHCYPDVPRFLSEVRRVLRPGGSFLYADFRDTPNPLADLRRQLDASGMALLAADDISPHVVRGMAANHDHSLALIRRLVPRPLHPVARRFAGVKDSAIYNALLAGHTVYLCCHLQKPATP